jgi:DNA-binding MarR family transcriptional regulator
VITQATNTTAQQLSGASPGIVCEGTQHKLQVLFAEVTALAHQLNKTSAKTRRRFDDCRAGALSLLRILDQQGGQTVPAIARARGVSRQNVQVLVNRLRGRNLVTLTQNPAHKRSALVHLTDSARALLTTASQQEMESREALLPYISEVRLVPATTLVRQLRQLLGGAQLPEQPWPRQISAPAAGAPPRRNPRRKRAAPAATEMLPPPEAGEPDEGEFPVNLL